MNKDIFQTSLLQHYPSIFYNILGCTDYENVSGSFDLVNPTQGLSRYIYI